MEVYCIKIEKVYQDLIKRLKIDEEKLKCYKQHLSLFDGEKQAELQVAIENFENILMFGEQHKKSLQEERQIVWN